MPSALLEYSSSPILFLLMMVCRKISLQYQLNVFQKNYKRLDTKKCVSTANHKIQRFTTNHYTRSRDSGWQQKMKIARKTWKMNMLEIEAIVNNSPRQVHFWRNQIRIWQPTRENNNKAERSNCSLNHPKALWIDLNVIELRHEPPMAFEMTLIWSKLLMKREKY